MLLTNSKANSTPDANIFVYYGYCRASNNSQLASTGTSIRQPLFSYSHDHFISCCSRAIHMQPCTHANTCRALFQSQWWRVGKAVKSAPRGAELACVNHHPGSAARLPMLSRVKYLPLFFSCYNAARVIKKSFITATLIKISLLFVPYDLAAHPGNRERIISLGFRR